MLLRRCDAEYRSSVDGSFFAFGEGVVPLAMMFAVMRKIVTMAMFGTMTLLAAAA